MKLPRLFIPTAPAESQAGNGIAQKRFSIQSAAANGHTAVLLELLKQHPQRKRDALYWAAGNGRVDTVAALLGLGTYPTPMSIAAAESNDHHDIVSMLRRHIQNQ
jgi:hypothetical protein